MRSAKNILRHELIGLDCHVAQASNRSSIGISGRIADETMKTLVISQGGKRKRIQKKGSVFAVAVAGKKVSIAGDAIVARPEDRIKKKFKKW